MVVGSLVALVQNQDWLIHSLLFLKPLDGLMLALWWILYVCLWAALILCSFLLGPVVADIFATPCYEIISERVERDFTSQPPRPINIWASVKLIGEEVKKAVTIIGLSVLVLPIPLLNLILPPFLVACDFYDYPMARRGYGFKKRLSFVLQDGWAVLGFGLWFTIPFIQFFIMPLAVAGGTILAVRRLDKVTES